jgi:uroporphyrinogen-III synthase
MRRLFVFRPEPAASRTVEKANAMGLETRAIPLFELEAIDWALPDAGRFDAILLTSANAVDLAGEKLERLRALPVHAVGEASAVAACVAGFGVATVGNGGINELLALIEPEQRLLHLCGEDRRGPREARQPIEVVPVFRAKSIEVSGLSEELRGQVAVLHSPRAAQRLADLVQGDARSTVRVAAISQATAEAAGVGWEDVRSAETPSDTVLLALAARLCKS